MERRLAAIMVADVVGYSRLIRADEEGTITALKALRADLIDPKLAEHHGRIVKLMGDGMLAEFASVVDAVRAAVEIQQAVTDHNTDLPADKRIEFRVGINLGDVVIDGDDILGDGVNVAARLEGLAEPGGIRVSGMVYEGVRDRIDIPFEDLGEQEFKNIDRPIRVWRWSEAEGAAPAVTGREALPLPDKPSIAVLAFDNMSGDPEQEYFSDGITEDVITELSRFPDFMVIARNSTFSYKHKTIDPKQVGRELGVQFVLEGSVRRVGDRVRITGQLIDSATGGHLWAERYDRDIKDIFAVQDEITQRIVGALGHTIHADRIRRGARKEPDSLDAYDLTLQASAQNIAIGKENNVEARRLAERAIARDPGYGQAHAILAVIYLLDFTSHWTDDPEAALQRSYETAKHSVSLDPNNYISHRVIGLCETWRRRYDQAMANFRRAIELNPNDADTRAHFANALVFGGRPEEALAEIETAIRLNPHYPASYMQFRGRAYFVQRRYEEAEQVFDQAVTMAPEWPWAHLTLAAARAALGDPEAAEREVAEALKISPALSLDHVPKAWPYKNHADLVHFVDWLRKAGLPAK